MVSELGCLDRFGQPTTKHSYVSSYDNVRSNGTETVNLSHASAFPNKVRVLRLAQRFMLGVLTGYPKSEPDWTINGGNTPC